MLFSGQLWQNRCVLIYILYKMTSASILHKVKRDALATFLRLTSSVWQNWHMLWIELHSRVYWYDLITLQDLRVKTVHFRLNYMMYLIIAMDQKSVSHYILTSKSSNFFSRHLYWLFFQQIKSPNVQSSTIAAKRCVLKLFMSI